MSSVSKINNVLKIITEYNELRDGSLKDMTSKDMFFNFGRILILCLKNGTVINKDTVKDINNFILLPAPINIIKNSILFKQMMIIRYEYLEKYFKIERKQYCDVEQKELILNFSNIDEIAINSFLLQFDGISNFEDYIRSSLVNNLINLVDYSEEVQNNRIKMLESINENNYWTNNRNCLLNITLQFINRGFNLNLIDKINDVKIKDVIQKINNNSEDTNYLSFLYRKQVYVDAASNLEKSGYKLYKIVQNDICEKMSMESFNNFITDNIKMSDKEFYYLVMNLLASKDLCHYIINNKQILLRLHQTKFYSKYFFVFKYLLSYAWLTFYLEESIKKRNVKQNDRFIFDIETASLLPETPITTKDITISAYFPLLVSEEIYNYSENILGVSPVYEENIRYGVADLITFKTRINMFVSENPEINLLNINWNNIAISGSIIACCLPNFNPLMLNFMTKEDILYNSKKFNKYINEYYRDADIDMLCNLDGFEFIDKVHEIKNSIIKNIQNNIIFEKDYDQIVILKPIKSVAIMINTDFINKYLVSSELNFGDIVVNINDIKIKTLLYPFYLDYKYKKNKEYVDTHYWHDNKYADEFDICSIENIQVVFGRTKDDKENDKNVFEESVKDSLINEDNVLLIINENLKYKMFSDFLKHNIELFKIRFTDFFGTVTSFHLPIVRAYYDGSTVKMTPSCISACHTMLNIDYKYFAGSKDPIEIINKYRCRGFGTILNDKEKVRFFKYNNMVDKWKRIYPNNNNCLGFKARTHNIFKYSINFYGENTVFINDSLLLYDYNYVINKIYDCRIINNIEIVKIMCSDLKCINKYGYVSKMLTWIIDAVYNMINNV